jgi:predicted dinucleotide-binding enzyme
MLPDGRVVKAFNIVGNYHMFRPDFPGGPPTMFICGNDEQAKKIVTGILDSFGWETIDIGGVEWSHLHLSYKQPIPNSITLESVMEQENIVQ